MLNSHSDVLKLLKLDDSEYIRNNTNYVIGCCVQKYDAQEIQLCDIVERLQPLLTNSSPTERALGTQFLVDVLQSLSTSKVNSQELKFLSQFFADRLKDQHSVVPHAIVGLITLVKQVNISSDDVKALIQALFREVFCQSQVLADRRNIYSFLKFCILNKTEEVKQINDEFILGYISAVEGEKDPRNLMLLFSFFPFIAQQLSLKNFAEDMFEVVAAYFPIEFVPPKRDGFVVTAEDLIMGLRNCLASTDEFAPYCIPLLQEKLDSDVVLAKLDSLLTLQACCKNFSGASLTPFVLPLWASLRREVIEGWKVEVETEAMTTLSCLVAALETDPSSGNAVKELGSSALMECLPHLAMPEQRLVFPSSDVLLSLAKSSSTLSKMFCEKVLPVLVDQFNHKRESIGRKNSLIVMSKLLRQGAEFEVFEGEPLLGYRSACFECLLEGLGSDEKTVKEAAVAGVASAAKALSQNQLRQASVEMTSLVTESVDSNLRTMVINALVLMEKSNSAVVKEVLARLVDSIRRRQGQTEERDKMKSILGALSALSTSAEAVKQVLPQVWAETLRRVMEGEELGLLFIGCIYNMVVTQEEETLRYLAMEWRGVYKFQALAMGVIAAKRFADPIPVLEKVSDICRILTPSVSDDEDTRKSFPEEGQPLLKGMPSFSNDDIRSSLLIYCMEFLFVHAHATPDAGESLLTRVKEWSLREQDERVRERAAAAFASYLLHAPSEEELSRLLRPLEEEFSNAFGMKNSSDSQASSVYLLGWIVKGLIMRAYADDLSWIQKLETLLLNSEFGHTASTCYMFLLKDDTSLYTSSGAEPKFIRILYRQRFFERRIEPLVKQFREAEGKGKNNTLLAILNLLPYLPQAVLKGHLPKLLPVLVQGLRVTDSAVTSGAVETLSCLLGHNAVDVISHVSAMIPSLLTLATTSTVAVRIKSLECLETLALLPSTEVVPHRTEVIQKLKSALNDKKRVVRRAAASTRSAWILI